MAQTLTGIYSKGRLKTMLTRFKLVCMSHLVTVGIDLILTVYISFKFPHTPFQPHLVYVAFG